LEGEGEGNHTNVFDTEGEAFLSARSLELIASRDTVSLYLKEMACVPLLSAVQEVSLAQRIERGRQARMEFLGLNACLSQRQRDELENSIRDAQLAREELILANTRLVVSIARRYLGCGIPFLDLIQEGNLGLMRAVEKFDPRRGFRFSTYATWWIRQGISRSIAENGRTIRIPVHMHERLRHLYEKTRELEQQLGRPPSLLELAGELGINVHKLRWLVQVAQTPISLDSPVSEDNANDLGVVVEDTSAPNPSQVASDNLLKDCMDQALASLSPREARVLRMRFGLGQERAYTLEEVGQKFGLTRERIRQIESKALRQLRQPSLAFLLVDYL
jgi:RNA polymerase primary sigma factor